MATYKLVIRYKNRKESKVSILINVGLYISHAIEPKQKGITFAKAIQDIEKAIENKETIDQREKNIFIVQFNASEDIPLQQKAIPLIFKLNQGAFYQLAKDFMLNKKVSIKVKSAFWDEIAFQIVKSYKVDKKVNEKTMALLDVITPENGADISQFKRAVEIQNIIAPHSSMSKTLLKHPSLQKQYPEIRKKLLMPEAEGYQYFHL